MQEEKEGRYVVQEFDAQTWSIIDTVTAQVYVLMVAPLGNFTVQLAIIEVLAISGNPRFLHFLSEVMSAQLTVYDDETGTRMARFVLSELESQDIANPINLARQLGADLHGQRVDWFPVKALQ